MVYNSVKAQNLNLHTKQYKFFCQNDGTTLNALKAHKKTQNNACMGFITPNFKNTNFQKLKFFPVKFGGRALPGGKALTPILNG